MTRRKTKRLQHLRQTMGRAIEAAKAKLRTIRFPRRWRSSVRVEVLVANEKWRSTLEAEVRRVIRQLERVLGRPLDGTGNIAIIVQQVIKTDRQLAGCYQTGKRNDETRFALVRLALQVNGRRLDLDEVLAVLVEQWIALSVQEGGGNSVLVPFELAPREAAQPVARPALRPDPLSPRSNGSVANTKTGAP